MAEITKNFTYDIPNEYLSQSNSDGDTATASYTGPDRLYVYVDADTGRNTLSQSPPDEDFIYNPTTDTTLDGERLVTLDNDKATAVKDAESQLKSMALNSAKNIAEIFNSKMKMKGLCGTRKGGDPKTALLHY